MSKRRKLFITVLILFIISIVYTLLVKYYDVAKIGPENSAVGFSGINALIHKTLPYNDFWYKVTKYLGIVPFLYCAFYGLIGVAQLIKHKTLKKIDKRLIYLVIFYVVMLIVYVLCDKIVVNYRPILEDGALESSFPSSHTLLACCVCVSSLLIAKYYIKNQKILKIFNYGTIILMIVLVVGRLLSGVHWLTDIIGGIIYSVLLIYLYYSCIYTYKKTRD